MISAMLDNARKGFWRNVDQDGPLPKHRPELGPCWQWKGFLDAAGYGRTAKRDGTFYVHRRAYQSLIGPIPNGLEIDHLCRNRGCANPAHMEAVTHRENVLRGDTVVAKQARKTHCVHGHPFDEANTYWRKTPHGVGRMCRQCSRDRREAQKTAA